MATRFIKDTIWTSPNLNELSDLAERHFYRLLPLPDDHGCCELTPAVVKGRCYPLKTKITLELIQKWTNELIDADIVRVWEDKGRLYGWFPTWSGHQRVRSLNKRKTPEPPTTVVNCRQSSQIVASYSLPHFPSPSPSPSCSSGDERFEEFWKEYPKKKNKGDAEKAWKALNPNSELQLRIMAALHRAKKSTDWAKDGGQYVPYPASWLRAKGWEDVHPKTIVDPKTGIVKMNPVYRDEVPPAPYLPPPIHDPPKQSAEVRQQIMRELGIEGDTT